MKQQRHGRRQQFDAATRRKVYESGRRYAFGWDQHKPRKRQRDEDDMASFNKVIIMGNLTRDPQLKHLPNNTAVAEFGMAVNRKYKTSNGEQKEDVVFVECAAFGNQGETIAKFCTKGKPLHIEGRLKYDTWEDKQGGGKRSKLSITVESFQFIGTRDGNEVHGAGDSAPAGRQHTGPFENRRPGRRQQPQAPFGNEPEMDPADIPF